LMFVSGESKAKVKTFGFSCGGETRMKGRS
jgi:hypothetical protein